MELRNLSAALWDEDTFTISLNHKHCTDHIKDHKADAEYLNKPIEHFGKMLVIFGNSLAIGKYAKGSSDPLTFGPIPVDDDDDLDERGADSSAPTRLASAVAGGNEDNGASSSAPKPKKAKLTAAIEEDGLIGAFKSVGEKLAVAIVEAGKGDNHLAENLFESVHEIPGFEEAHLAYYHAHLVDNPCTARVFVTLPFLHKVTWVSRYIATTFNE